MYLYFIYPNYIFNFNYIVKDGFRINYINPIVSINVLNNIKKILGVGQSKFFILSVIPINFGGGHVVNFISEETALDGLQQAAFQ